MEASLYYQVNFNHPYERKQFEFTGNSGSKWTLIQDWIESDEPFHQLIKIQKKTLRDNQLYFLHADVYTLDNMLLSRKSVKCHSQRIEIKLYREDLEMYHSEFCRMHPMRYNFNMNFYYRIELFPILETYSTNEYESQNGLAKQEFKTLSRDLSTMLRDPMFNEMYDVLFVSGTKKVKANRNILSVRLPELFDQLNFRQRKEKLTEIKLCDSAAEGLADMVAFLYSAEYSKNMWSLGYLSLTAKEMGSMEYQKMFMDEIKLSVDNIICVIYFADQGSYCIEKALTFLAENYELVICTSAWNVLEVVYICLSRANRYCQSTRVERLKLSFYIVVEFIYERE